MLEYDPNEVVRGEAPDIFGMGDKDYIPGKHLNARFQRNSTFDEDMVSLIQKWKGTTQELYIKHMLDSLILFNHNRNQLGDVNTSDKFGKAEIWQAIQLLLHS